MANNKLMKTDSFWYKIKQFFRKTFSSSNKSVVENYSNNDFEKDNVSKIEIEHIGIKNDLLTKVLKRDVDIDSLTNQEVDEVTEELILEIDKMDKELEKIKANIIRMKNKLENK